MSEALDIGYTPECWKDGELVHRYGDQVKILCDPYHMSLLATLSAKATGQPWVNQLVRTLYEDLVVQVAAREFPLADLQVDTRMIDFTPQGVFRGTALDRATRVAIVDLARAGILPATVCFDRLNHVLEPAGVRQDHLIMNRTTDSAGRVTGAEIFGGKTGHEVDGRFVLFPDPMGATGSSLIRAIEYYKARVEGVPKRILTLNLIVTPEFIRNLRAAHPEVHIYAYRLDRGASPAEVLASIPGSHPERECGLNEVQYIVPGAGGLGEVINNCFV